MVSMNNRWLPCGLSSQRGLSREKGQLSCHSNDGVEVNLAKSQQRETCSEQKEQDMQQPCHPKVFQLQEVKEGHSGWNIVNMRAGGERQRGGQSFSDDCMENYSKTVRSCYCCSVVKSHLILCNPMDCNMPDFPVLHYLLKFVQTRVHGLSGAIQSSLPLPPVSPALNLSQHRGLFQ